MLSTRPLEIPLAVVLHAEQSVLCHRHVQELHHLLQLGDEAPLQLLVVDDEQALPVLQPVQDVRGPPRGVAAHEIGPLCKTGKPGQTDGSPATLRASAFPTVTAGEKPGVAGPV